MQARQIIKGNPCAFRLSAMAARRLPHPLLLAETLSRQQTLRPTHAAPTRSDQPRKASAHSDQPPLRTLVPHNAGLAHRTLALRSAQLPRDSVRNDQLLLRTLAWLSAHSVLQVLPHKIETPSKWQHPAAPAETNQHVETADTSLPSQHADAATHPAERARSSS